MRCSCNHTGADKLSCADTTIVGFTRDLAPGIRVLRGGILWLDNVSFKRLAQIPRRRPRASPVPEGTAVVAYKESVLIFVVCLTPTPLHSLFEVADSRYVRSAQAVELQQTLFHRKVRRGTGVLPCVHQPCPEMNVSSPDDCDHNLWAMGEAPGDPLQVGAQN